MIEASEQKANSQNIATAKFSKADLFNVSFQNSSFDTVSTFNVLHYIHDKRDFYLRIHELLKPNGLFISSTACLRERGSILRFIMSGLTAFNFVPKMIFYKTSELETEIREAGFTILESYNITKLPERFIIARKD
ncbi:MAG: class I SAM-dependent methyltransferase, partial [Cytophagales bacterium]|nr:class I SAM-dependent methyltransferase [Cytophagales bacterium]